MAELEIKNAVDKIRKTAKSKDHSTWEKIQKIGVEIAVIVFAVSVSIGFHRWSDSRHDQHEVTLFLTGLRTDLKKDILEMQKDVDSYLIQKKAFLYFSALPKGTPAHVDSIRHYSKNFLDQVGFQRNSGRYEGFKTSGKMLKIEDDDLQDEILDLYEETKPILINSTDDFQKQKTKFADYIVQNAKGYPAGNMSQILSSDQVKNYSVMYLVSIDNIINNYENCIVKMENINRKIDSAFPPKN